MKEQDDLTSLLLNSDHYLTSERKKRTLGDKLALNTRIYFQGRFVGICFATRSEARRGLYDTARWVSSSHEILRLIEDCGGKFRITGLNNIKNCGGPAVLLSNHMSTLETMVFPGIIQPLKDVTFVVKDALIRNRFFGDVMRSRDPIVLSRHHPREDFGIVMEQGRKRISNGISVIIFPQSTRRMNFIPSEFNSIGIKLALRAGVPVIPIAIDTAFWANGRYTKYLGRIHRDKPIRMEFGEAIQVTEPGKTEHRQVIDFIATRLEKWKKEDL
jgi:1-acyl-sn-glycerol-3-phosphate acyltransferase